MEKVFYVLLDTKHNTALICNVEKIFHQFHVHEAARDLLSYFLLYFLWRKNGNSSALSHKNSTSKFNDGLKYPFKVDKILFPIAWLFILRPVGGDVCQDKCASVDKEKAIQTICAIGELRRCHIVATNLNVFYWNFM